MNNIILLIILVITIVSVSYTVNTLIRRKKNNFCLKKDNTLPIIVIATNGKNIDTREKQDILVTLSTNNNIDNTNTKSAKINLRGQSSSTFDKKQWKIKFKNKTTLLGMSNSKKYVLQGPYIDKSLIRDKLAFDLGRKIGAVAPKVELVELFINTSTSDLDLYRDYRGVYILIEKIEVHPEKLNIGPKDYLFKCDKIYDDDLPYRFVSNYNTEIILVTPDDISKLSGLEQIINNFESILYSDNESNEYQEYIDLDSFVNFFIINEISNNQDSYRWSTYLYTKNGKIYAGPLWDFNMAFGEDKYSTVENWRFETSFNNEGKTYVSDHHHTQYKGISSWYYKLFKIRSFKQAVINRFFYLKYTNKLLDTKRIKNMFEEEYVQPLTSKYRICYNNKPLYYNETSPSERNFIRWNILSTNKNIIPKWVIDSSIKEPLPKCYSGDDNWLLCENNKDEDIKNQSAIGRVYLFLINRINWIEKNL